MRAICGYSCWCGRSGIEGVILREVRGQTVLGTRMLEDAEVDALALGLDGPGDGLVLGNVNPADYVALGIDVCCQ